MKQILFSPGNKKQLFDCIDKSDSYIIGVENLSVNFLTLSIEEIKELLNNTNKDIYIALNKNMANSDLPYLENILTILNEYPIKGIFYADVALIPMINRLKINIPLIWSNEHLTTNYHTMNYWYQFGVSGTFISNEVTLEEIINILKNYKGKKIVQVFGYLPMYVSKRHAIKNYLNHFDLKTTSKTFSLSKEGKQYPIIDSLDGTSILSSNILCDFDGYNKLCDNGLDLALINGYGIDDDIIGQVIDTFVNLNVHNLKKEQQKIDQLINNIDSGFWYRKTIYKVKRNEK